MCFVFFFNDTATTEIYTLSLHDALPISEGLCARARSCEKRFASPFQGITAATRISDSGSRDTERNACRAHRWSSRDRKSTRLNSSHQIISYAVFCLKKKKSNCLQQKDST